MACGKPHRRLTNGAAPWSRAVPAELKSREPMSHAT